MVEAVVKKKARPSRLKAMLVRFGPSLRVLVPIAFATLLLALAGFFAWQGWLVWQTEHGAVEADRVRADTIIAIAGQIGRERQHAQQALLDPAVQQALGGAEDAPARAAAATAMKRLLPGATDVEFFSPNLDEVLSGDLQLIGYAKAAELMQAKVNPARPLAETRIEKDAGRQLMLALPAKVGDRTVAVAVVELPFEPILRTFLAARIHGA